jgi:hypothetical protein
MTHRLYLLRTWFSPQKTRLKNWTNTLAYSGLRWLARKRVETYICRRKIKDDVKDNPSLYSIIYVPNGFIVPGGNFF